MTRNLPMVMAATGQLADLPGVRIENGDLPAIRTGVNEYVAEIMRHLDTIVNSTARIGQFELEAIANQLRVAGMPDPTIFQKAGAVFHQNYARERATAEKTVVEAAEISRGIAGALGYQTDGVPNSQIHGRTYAAVRSEIERTVTDVFTKVIAYQQLTTSLRMQEIGAYSTKAAEMLRALNPMNPGRED